MEDKPICTNCKHYESILGNCTKYVEIEMSLVTGRKVNISIRDSFVERSIGECGPEGKNYEPKYKDNFLGRMKKFLNQPSTNRGPG